MTPQPAAQTTHRRLGPLIAVALTAILTACSTVAASDGTTTSESPDGTSRTSPAGAVIDFSYGGYEAQVPADPQRVIALDSRAALEFSILADYPLVATAYNEDSHLNQHLPDDIGQIVGETEPDKEAILSYEPDLLVVSEGWWDYYESENIQIDDIAPVLVVANPSTTEDGGTALDAASEQLEILGRDSANDEAIAAFETSLAEAKATYGPTAAGKTIAVVGLSVDGWWALTDTSELTVRLAADLGYTILDDETIQSAEAANTGPGSAIISWELVDSLAAADVILAQNLDVADGIAAWDTLASTSEASVVELDYEHRSGFVLTHQDFLDALVAATAALED